MVEREVERAGERAKLANILWDRSIKKVSGEVKLDKVFQFRPNSRRDFAGKLVSRKNQPLQLQLRS
jgi:hypothetical protein